MPRMIACILIACLFTGTSFAQSADEKKVAEMVETLRKAMLASDTNQLKSLVSDEVSYGHSNGLVEDKAAFVDEYVTGKSIFVTLDFSEQTIKVMGDVAVVRNHFIAETNNVYGNKKVVRQLNITVTN